MTIRIPWVLEAPSAGKYPCQSCLAALRSESVSWRYYKLFQRGCGLVHHTIFDKMLEQSSSCRTCLFDDVFCNLHTSWDCSVVWRNPRHTEAWRSYWVLKSCAIFWCALPFPTFFSSGALEEVDVAYFCRTDSFNKTFMDWYVLFCHSELQFMSIVLCHYPRYWRCHFVPSMFLHGFQILPYARGRTGA